jgi:hypothetical protein
MANSTEELKMTDFVRSIPFCRTSPSSRIEPAFLGEKQVASFLNVSVQALRKWRANCTGPVFHRIQGCIRYPIDGLRKYIAETQCDFTGQDKTRPTTKNGGARHG